MTAHLHCKNLNELHLFSLAQKHQKHSVLILRILNFRAKIPAKSEIPFVFKENGALKAIFKGILAGSI